MLAMDNSNIYYDDNFVGMSYRGDSSPASTSSMESRDSSSNAPSPMSVSMSPHSVSSTDNMPPLGRINLNPTGFQNFTYVGDYINIDNDYLHRTHHNAGHYATLQNINVSQSPFLKILEQPVDKFRFRYKSEMMGTHGSLMGRKTEKNRKTYPTVELNNWTGPAIIRCSLYQADDKNRSQHTHRLVLRHGGSDEDSNDPHDVIVNKENGYLAVFPGMGIIHTAKKHIADELVRKKVAEINSNPLNKGKIHPMILQQIKEKALQEAKTMNLNTVCLGFEAFKPETYEPICSRIYSTPINNMKSALTGELKISRMSKNTSSCIGQEEIFMFVEKVGKKNIKVRFFEMDEDENEVWEDWGRFSELDVHHQYAIALRTPPYRDSNIEKAVDVSVQLYRPSDGDRSEPIKFSYKPCGRITGSDRKRARTESSFNSAELPICLTENLPSGDSLDLDKIIGDNPQEMNSNEFLNFVNAFGTDFQESLTAELMYTNTPHLRTDGGYDSREIKVVQPNKTDIGMEETPYDERVIKVQIKKILQEIASGKSKDSMDQIKKSVRKMYYQGNDGNSVLHYAIENGQMDLVREILNLLTQIGLTEALNEVNDKGETCLHSAVRGNHPYYIKPLLSSGVNPNIENHEGHTVLHVAAHSGNTIIISQLLNSNSSRVNKIDINQQSSDGCTALHMAVREKHHEAVVLLIKNGANVNVKETLHGCTPLHIAVELNSESIVTTLLKAKDINVDAQNSTGHTPLHLACVVECGSEKGSLNLVKLLLDSKADPTLAYSSRSIKAEQTSDEEDDADVDESEAASTALNSFDLASSNPEILRILNTYIVSVDTITEVKTEPNIKDEVMDVESVTIKLEHTSNMFDEICLTELCSILDKCMAWKQLIPLLDYSSLQSVFEKAASPTRSLIDQIELQGDLNLQNLVELLSAIQQNEAVTVIDQMIARQSEM